MHLELLRTRSEIATLGMAAGRLMGEAFTDTDATLTPQYFLASLEPKAEPRVVACYENGRLLGVLFTAELYFCGIRTGYAYGGDAMGRGLLVAPPERERELLAATTAFLLEHGLHGMRLHWTPRQSMAGESLKLAQKTARVSSKLDPHPEGDWLQLEPTYDGFLSRIGPHTRRNLRYYRRKVEACGYEYTGLLRTSDLVPALHSLNLVADYPLTQGRLDRDRRFFEAFQTPVIAGLRDQAGAFISLVTGFTTGTHLHILTQLNGESEALRKLSLSLVLRGFLIEEFIQRGFTAVHFIHGSSPMLGRFCGPVPLQLISIDNQTSLATPFKKICSSLAGIISRRGRRVPYRLQWAAGSYLP